MKIHEQALEGTNVRCLGCYKVYTYLSSLIKHRKRCLNQSSQGYCDDNDYQMDLLQENREEETLLKKIIKKEPKTEENSNFSVLKEENDESNLKENISESYDLKIETPTEPKVEVNEFDCAAGHGSQQNQPFNFQRHSQQEQFLPAFNQNSIIPAELQAQVLCNISNPTFRPASHTEMLRKTAMTNNSPLSLPFLQTQFSNAIAMAAIFKQLEEAREFRRLLYDKFFFSE